MYIESKMNQDSKPRLRTREDVEEELKRLDKLERDKQDVRDAFNNTNYKDLEHKEDDETSMRVQR